MKLHLNDIQHASECMRYYRFLQQVKIAPKNKQLSIAEQVIKKCYIHATESGFRAQWRIIVGWVDAAVFKKIDVNNNEQFEIAKKTSEHILVFLAKWYKQIYLPENTYGYADVALSQQLGHHTIYSTVPVVKLGEPPVIVLLGDIVYNATQLYNNINARGLAFMLSKSLESEEVCVQYTAIGSSGGTDTVEITLGEKDHKRAEKTISDIAIMIDGGVNFPSVTAMCSQCPFSRRCKL